jgi:hypothetical protein
MIMSDVINKISRDMALETGNFYDLAIYRKYIQMALVVGIEHFYSDMEEVIAMDHEGREIGRYKSTQDAAEKLGLDRRDVSRVIQGVRHSCGGYLFIKTRDKELIPAKKTA